MVVCFSHYPTTKHTAVADTPENRRLAKNTALQSQVGFTGIYIVHLETGSYMGHLETNIVNCNVASLARSESLRTKICNKVREHGRKRNFLGSIPVTQRFI